MKFIKHILFAGIVGALSAKAHAQPAESKVTVPDSLTKNANVITYTNDINVEVESADKVSMKVHKVFSVLNEEGKDALIFHEFSTKFKVLDYVEIKVYDARGKQIGKYKKGDMVTTAYGEGLVDDGFVSYLPIQVMSYPVLVDLTYSKRLKSTLEIPPFRYLHEKEGILQSSYTITLPADINLRYHNNNGCNLTPAISNDKGKTFVWTVKNISPCEDEKGSANDNFPYVDLATDQFSYYGFQGDLSSWQSFGSWIRDLYKGLDDLPADRQAFFQNMVKDAPNEKEKIRRLYHYLQENFRYVSIQLGIGGLQPFSATFTDQKKYGDCKALSNYMKAMLKAVGINSNVAIINAEYNELPVDPAFPANNFNHVILCVPQKKDSIWLECTSSTIEFGTLGTFTENRNALLITDNGGVLVATPESKSNYNRINTFTTVKLDNDLSALAETNMNVVGEYQGLINEFVKEKKDDQKETIVYGLGYKQPDDFELATTDASSNMMKLKLSVSKLPEFNAGNKYFIKPRLNKITLSKLPATTNRKMDYFFHFPYEKSDTTVIILPKGFTLEALPSEKNLKTEYSNYVSKSWYNKQENAVYTATKLVLLKHRIPPASYAVVKGFFDEVLQDDAQRIVVNKSE